MLVFGKLEAIGYMDVSKLHAVLKQLIFVDRAKTMLAILAFLYWGEFVKNSVDNQRWSVKIPLELTFLQQVTFC